ncbi:hypothetical protein HY932_02900 [Candidatus Falkowbacteria bacterium]|nr:hypothetical protein [Candidatus Falkowbacteria bacterium]
MIAKQPDTLTAYVPKESDFYVHFNPSILTQIRPEIRNQLEMFANKTLEIKLADLAQYHEAGIFYYKNNYFIITPTTKQTFSKPAADNTFKKPLRIFDFSQFQLYLNKTPNFLANFVDPTNKTTTLYGKINKGSLCLYGSAPKLLKKNAAFIADNAILDKKISANGVLLNKTLAQPTNQLAQSLGWLFINNLAGPLEVQIAQNNDFIIGFDSNSNDIAKIKQILSLFYPKEIKLALPDSTTATHLIADSNIFTEKQTMVNGLPSSTLMFGSIEVLHFLKINQKTFIANNPKLLNSIASQPISTASKVDIYYKSFKFTFDYLICGKLRVCID